MATHVAKYYNHIQWQIQDWILGGVAREELPQIRSVLHFIKILIFTGECFRNLGGGGLSPLSPPGSATDHSGVPLLAIRLIAIFP